MKKSISRVLLVLGLFAIAVASQSTHAQQALQSTNVNNYIESISVDSDSVNVQLTANLEETAVAIILRNAATGSQFDISQGGIQGAQQPVSAVIELSENEYNVSQSGIITKIIPGGDVEYDQIIAEAIVPNEIIPETYDIISLTPPYLIQNLLEELPPSVTVTDLTWEKKDLITQSNGTYTYHLKSQSNIAKNAGDPVYLVLQKVSPAGETTYQFLGTYEPQLFRVCLPTPVLADINGDCDVNNLSVVDWGIEPGFAYSLYFSDRVNDPRAVSPVTNLETPVISNPGDPADPDPSGGNQSGGTDPTAPGSSGSVFNTDQQQTLASGIVSTDCGYNLASISDACGFDDFIRLLNNVVTWIIILILPIAVIVLAYTGFLFLTSGGNSRKRDLAKKAMTSLIIGIAVVLGAWLLVRTVVATLGYDTSSENDAYYLEQI
ncbi:hypothetical protein CL684_00905 [Candidatus Campbellbacteria bacterium]|nr:hypothetical protein [Candidatus Campbellbacteria bacterium]|tara:strand:+ start:620 stop:1924 length:1305 start_codon:yes stop_codon:yes gene_type:complete